jgi:hypothetical protein
MSPLFQVAILLVGGTLVSGFAIFGFLLLCIRVQNADAPDLDASEEATSPPDALGLVDRLAGFVKTPSKVITIGFEVNGKHLQVQCLTLPESNHKGDPARQPALRKKKRPATPPESELESSAAS